MSTETSTDPYAALRAAVAEWREACALTDEAEAERRDLREREERGEHIAAKEWEWDDDGRIETAESEAGTARKLLRLLGWQHGCICPDVYADERMCCGVAGEDDASSVDVCQHCLRGESCANEDETVPITTPGTETA